MLKLMSFDSNCNDKDETMTSNVGNKNGIDAGDEDVIKTWRLLNYD